MPPERTPERILEHYLIEKELASRLLAASREERRNLYSMVYDELFRRVPDHPQLARKASPQQIQANVDAQMRVLQPFLHSDAVYLEIGPGDCSLASAAAGKTKMVYAVDVSDEITRTKGFPSNFSLVLSDGVNVPVPKAGVDIAYSGDLIEHLHPDDAYEQLECIQEALVKGGRYLCVTPNRLSGPWDISGLFGQKAEGFHLKEYTVRELMRLFRKAGFSKLRILAKFKARYFQIPALLVVPGEILIDALPYRLKKKVSRKLRWLSFEYIRLIGTK